MLYYKAIKSIAQIITTNNMSKLSQQIREALGKLTFESYVPAGEFHGLPLILTKSPESISQIVSSLPDLLTDYERLEKEAEAGRKLFALCSKLTPDKVDEAERAFEKIVVEAKAGRELAEALEKMKPKKIDERNHANITVPVFGKLTSRLLLSREKLSEKTWSDRIKNALATYNSAVEKI